MPHQQQKCVPLKFLNSSEDSGSLKNEPRNLKKP